MFITCFLFSEFIGPFQAVNRFKGIPLEPITGLEPVTSSLPRMRSTTELYRHLKCGDVFPVKKPTSYQSAKVGSFIIYPNSLRIFFSSRKHFFCTSLHGKKNARRAGTPRALRKKGRSPIWWHFWRATCGASNRHTSRCTPQSSGLFLYHKRFAGHPEFEFYHFIFLVGCVEQMQIHLGIDHTVVEKFQLVEFLLNELQQFRIRFEMDGLRKYFHDGNVLRPSPQECSSPRGWAWLYTDFSFPSVVWA